MKTAIYPGSFDPVTFGHIDIIRRGSEIFDRLIVVVMHNSTKQSLFDVEERVKMLQRVSAEFPNVEIDVHDALAIEYCREKKVHTIVRGLRAITDFEYELQVAHVNRQMSEQNVDTVFLSSDLKYQYLSSSIAKEFARYGSDISKLVPDFVADRMREVYGFKEQRG